jgi:hypothetical protein
MLDLRLAAGSCRENDAGDGQRKDRGRTGDRDAHGFGDGSDSGSRVAALAVQAGGAGGTDHEIPN